MAYTQIILIFICLHYVSNTNQPNFIENLFKPIMRIDSGQIDKINKICSSFNMEKFYPKDYFDFAKSFSNLEKNFKFNSLQNLDDHPKAKILSSFLLKFLKNEGVSLNFSDLKGYFFTGANLFYVIGIVFGGLLLIVGFITLIFMIICCKTCYTCCKGKTTENSKKTNFFLLFLCLLTTILVAALCIKLAVYDLNLYKESVAATICSGLQFYNQSIHGQNLDVNPKWLGVEGIKQVIDMIQGNLTDLNKNIDVFNNTDFLENDPKQFNESITKFFQSYVASTLKNPNPVDNKIEGVIPYYIQEYNGKSDNSTSVLIVSNYISNPGVPLGLAEYLKQKTDLISKNFDKITSGFNDVITKFDKFTSGVNSFSNSANDIIDKYDKLQPIGNTVLNVFFAVIAFLNLFTALTILSLCCFKKSCFISFTSFSLILNFIIIIFFFLIGGIIGLIGEFSNDTSISVYYFSSTDNLNNLFNNSTTSGIINQCVNSDGDLYDKYFSLTSSDSNFVQDILIASSYINGNMTLLNSYKSIIPNLIATRYELYKLNFEQTSISNTDKNDIDSVMQEWQKWSNINTAGNYINSCTVKPQDYFTNNKINCETGYTQIQSTSPLFNLAKPSCLIIPEWTEEVSVRYSSLNNCGNNVNGFTSALNANIAYENSVNSYLESNLKLISDIENDLNQINDQINTTNDNLQKLYVKIQGLFKNFVEITTKSLDKNSLSQLFNCRYLALELNTFLQLMGNSFNTYSLELSIQILIGAFVNLLSIIITIILVRRYKSEFNQLRDIYQIV